MSAVSRRKPGQRPEDSSPADAMTSAEFRSRLAGRAERAGVAVPDPAPELLEAYFRLLGRWNPRINLTALPLDPPTDVTFDRLFVEPLAAASFFGRAHTPGRPGAQPLR